MNNLPTVISLCCGSGNGEVAAKKFFDTKLAVDNSWIARCSYNANHPSVMIVRDDIRNPHLISAAKHQYGKGDGIISSTPCTMFSSANSMSAAQKALDDNSPLYLSPLDWIESIKPRFYISENVPGVRKSPLFLLKLARLERLGYRCDCFILDAADFGTPQHRARLFLVAVCGDIPVPLPPKPTHGDAVQRRDNPQLLPYRTLKDSIYDLFELELEAIRSGRHTAFLNDEMKGCASLTDDRTWVLSHVPPGGNYKNLPEDVQQQVVEALRRKGKKPFAASWVPLALSKIKPSGRAYICTGNYPNELSAYLSVLSGIEGFTVGNVLVWTYRNTLGPSPKLDYKNNWQAVFYVRGADAPPLDCPLMVEQFSVQDINAPDGRIGDRFHSWQKPDALAERLIRHSTTAGDTVLDCFAGTGTFLLAAARLGRKATGCDASPEMIAIACERGCAHE